MASAGGGARLPSPDSEPGDGSERGKDRPLARRVDDDAVLAWLVRCRELAEASLDGIEDPALELANLAAGNRRLMERARRAIVHELERRPGDSALVQMQWFWRRAFEKGSWDWGDAAAVASGGGPL